MNRHLTWVPLLVTMALFGCGGGGPPPDAAPIMLRIELEDGLPRFVPRGGGLTFDLHVEHEGGVPAEDYVLVWTQGDTRVIGNAVHIAPGHERVTFGPFYRDDRLQFTARICPDGNYDWCDGGAIAVTPELRVVVHGGVPMLDVAHGGVTELTVGERRPIAAVGLVADAPGSVLRRFSHEAVRIEPRDGRIATVEDDNILVAVGPGTVEVDLVGNGVTETVTLTVHDPVDRPLTDFSNTTALLTGQPELGPNAGVTVPRGAKHESAVLDARGYPVVLTELGAPSQLAQPEGGSLQVLLHRWSGTGFGAENVFPTWVRPYFPVMVVDERGDVFVAAFDAARFEVVVARRALDALGQPFAISHVPAPDLARDADGRVVRRMTLASRGGGYDHDTLDTHSDFVTLHPRSGGGVHLAYTAAYELDACHRLRFEGTVDSSGAVSVTQTRDETWPLYGDADCDYSPMAVPGEVRFHAPLVAGGAPTLSNTRSRFETPTAPWLTRLVDGLPAPGIALDAPAFLLSGNHRHDDGDRVFGFGAGSHPFITIDPYGAYVQHTATELLHGTFQPTEFAFNGHFVAATAASGSRLVWVHDQLAGDVPRISSFTMPPALPLDGDEASPPGLAGRRIGRIAYPGPVTSVARLSDGRRIALVERLDFLRTEPSLPAIMTSTGPGASFEVATQRVVDGFDPHLPLVVHGTTAYTVTRPTYGTTRYADLHASTDGGASWSTDRIVPSYVGNLAGFYAYPTGRHLAAAVYANPTRTLSIHASSGDHLWAPPTGWQWNQDDVGFARDADASRVWLAAIATRPRTGGYDYRLVMRRYDDVLGVIDERAVDVPPGLRLHTFLRRANGDVCFTGGQYGVRADPVGYFLCIDPIGTITQRPVPAGATWHVHAAPLELGDGTIVMPLEVQVPMLRATARRAAYATSTNGVDFTDPIWLRPDGGYNQGVYALAVDGEVGTGPTDPAHVLFVVGDDGGLQANRAYLTDFDTPGSINSLTPPLVPLAIRVQVR